MKSLYDRLARGSNWYSENHPTVKAIPCEWQCWLLDKHSLTERLIDYSEDNFKVKVLSQRWEKPLPHEAVKLNIPKHLVARIREVELHCHNKPVVFARSVMPLKLYLEQRHTLQNIGTRPLGLLLFRDGRIRVSKRNVSVFSQANKPIVYGRSTPYLYYGNEILVSEFFIDECLVGKKVNNQN